MMTKHECRYCVPTFAVLVAVLLGLACVPGGQAAWAVTDLQWTWMKGSNDGYQAGTYGTLGTPAAENTPGDRESAATWTDASGALWLFGGSGSDSAGADGFLNDLWKYDRTTGEWTWMKGASTVGQAGIYGTKGSPAVANTPGARYGAVAWTDTYGGLWLFGGSGKDGAGNEACFNDLWRYDPSTGIWTWMKGTNALNQSGTYGTQGTAAAANTPGGRTGAVAWTDPSGALWLLGGVVNSSASYYDRNDLWKYDPPTGNWAWMAGDDATGTASRYGTLGTAAAANTPGGRYGAVSWTDASGALWLFGGYGKDGTGTRRYLNDLWKYDPLTGWWAWMKGATTGDQPGTAGTLGIPAAANTPSGRFGAVTWTDPSGAFWLFGGFGWIANGGGNRGLNGLWRYAVVVDTTPPTGSILINGNQTATKTVNVSLALNWDDGTGFGVTRMRFSNDGSTWTAWEALKHTRAYALPAGDGYKTVRVQYLDIAGNKSAVFNDFIRLDTVPPTGGILINNGATTTTALKVTLKLNWADVGSGVTRMRFSDNGSTWSAWTSQRATYAYTLPAGLGYHTVRVQFTDAATNYSPIYNDYIKVVAP